MMFGGRHMRGLAQGTAKPVEMGKTTRRLLHYFHPYRAGLIALLGLALAGTLLQVAGPYLTGVAVDQFLQFPTTIPRPGWLDWILPAGADRGTGLTLTMILLLASYLLAQVAQGGQLYLMNVIGQRVLLTMRTQIFERIQTLSLKFFDRHEAGDLMSRLVNDTQVINQVFSIGLVRALGITMQVIGISIAMVALNWRLALVSFTILPVIVVTTVLFSYRARTAFRRSRETLGDVSAELEENIANVREVQAFSREEETMAEFQRVNVANRDAFVTAQTLASAFSPALNVLSTVALAIVIGYGGYLVLTPPAPPTGGGGGGLVSVGVIVSFLTYVRRFYDPIRQLANLYARLQEALAGAERIFDLLDTEPEIVSAPDAIELPPIKGHVVFDHVHFAYKGDEQVLQDISLEALPGQTVALVGPTGAGKTTVVNLLARFYDVDQGAVRVDGYDVRQVTPESLRQQMGIVLQDTFLFSGTVIDNIRYGRLDADDEEVIAAARLANADQFITRLPEGYQTQLGERGHNLSQGQRQLIAIARAVLADPRVLILDEATSSVDTRTELLIQQALDELLKGRTSFVIAHRLSTVRHAHSAPR